MKKMRFTTCVLLSITLACCASGLRAESIPAVEIDTAAQGSGATRYFAGYTFIPSEDITVSQLGVIDGNGDGVTAGGQEVGLYRWGFSGDSGELLRSVTVSDSTSTEAAGNFNACYADITPITLSKDTQYYVTAVVVGADLLYTANLIDPESRPWTMTYAVAKSRAADELLPTDANSGVFNIINTARLPGYLGGTFKYQPVPEPSTLALLALGAMALCIRRKI